ncbi:Transcriptional regulator, partial [Dysosmobacter welbionis]
GAARASGAGRTSGPTRIPGPTRTPGSPRTSGSVGYSGLCVFCHLPAGVFQRQLNLFECGSNGCDRPHCAGIYHSAPPATGS